MEPTLAFFQVLYPAFADMQDFPQAVLEYYFGMALERLQEDLWGDSRAQGVYLYAAHMLALWKAQGDLLGARGLVTDKTVGPAHVGYDFTLTAVQDAGHWNLTAYGQQFKRLSNMVGRSAKSQYYGNT